MSTAATLRPSSTRTLNVLVARDVSLTSAATPSSLRYSNTSSLSGCTARPVPTMSKSGTGSNISSAASDALVIALAARGLHAACAFSYANSEPSQYAPLMTNPRSSYLREETESSVTSWTRGRVAHARIDDQASLRTLEELESVRVAEHAISPIARDNGGDGRGRRRCARGGDPCESQRDRGEHG